MSDNLLSKYASFLTGLNDQEIAEALSRPELKMEVATVGSKEVEMVYAPFDHVNPDAQVVIVGLTPGRQQASNALIAARKALQEGLSPAEASARAKVFASFSGPMRSNLVRMLDKIGVSRTLGLASASQLWSDASHLAHFTSLLRYPVFVDGENWSGQPSAVRTAAMRHWLDEYTGKELSQFKDAIIVPLGPKVSEGLEYLAQRGCLDPDLILSGLPHPSGANAERIACFLGEKSPEDVSPKTNASALITARESIMARVGALSAS